MSFQNENFTQQVWPLPGSGPVLGNLEDYNF